MTPAAERSNRDEPPLRVALVASSFAPHVGGVETHVAQVARELRQRGHAIEVWTVDRGARASSQFALPVRYLPTPLPSRSVRGLSQFAAQVPRAFSQWTRAMREFQPDVLAVQCFGPNGLYALAAHSRSGLPLVITSHGETLGDDAGVYARSALLRRGLRDAIAAAGAVTAPSEYVLSDLRERFAMEEGTVIPNGIEPSSHVVPAQRRTDLLLAVGRLGRMKGFDLLIDAFVEADLPGVQLEIIGDGPERQTLREQIAQAGFMDRIRLAGQATPDAVVTRMAAATAVIVPSRSEAFGIVALEAWQAQAPLVITLRGGAAEFVRDGEDGLLVDPLDRSAFVGAIRRVMSDPQLRRTLAAHGLARVPEFAWTRVAEEYERVFRAAIGGAP